MTVKITGFADEIAPELTAQIAGLKGLGMSYVEMRGAVSYTHLTLPTIA